MGPIGLPAKDMLEEKLHGARRVRITVGNRMGQQRPMRLIATDIRQRAVGILERYFGESEIEAMTGSDDDNLTTDDSGED